MSMMKIKISGREVNLAWLVAMGLYVSCWFLPIHIAHHVQFGYDGAEFAHKEFWRLLSGETAINTLGDVFGVIFVSLGWMANELFVAGAVALWKWPHIAVRLFAFSLAIMISWQLSLPKEFPFLVGYWVWIVSGAMALGLAATDLADARQSTIGAVLSDRITLALLLVPIFNAAIAGSLGFFSN